MEEAQFSRELNRYKVVRRPEHVGPLQRKRDLPSVTTAGSTGGKASSAKTAAPSKVATAATSSATPVVVTPGAHFWDLLASYVSERMPKEDAIKLIDACKDLHGSIAVRKNAGETLGAAISS